jgi:GNAT superfamily N-acetyltransferase
MLTGRIVSKRMELSEDVSICFCYNMVKSMPGSDSVTYPISYADENEKNYVRRKLIEYNAQHIPDHLKSRYEEINLAIKDDNGNIIGGLIAVLCWNWIEVDILWVDSAFRLKGTGTQLLNEIEKIASEKDCNFIKLNTFSFQAPNFYIKNGYNQYSVLENAPEGAKHFFFKKDINSSKIL